jgi:hypothetical protein
MSDGSGGRGRGDGMRNANSQACRKSGVTCEWPSGRRKKRTRKEMEEARRLEAQLRPEISPTTVGRGFSGLSCAEIGRHMIRYSIHNKQIQWASTTSTRPLTTHSISPI